MLRLQIDAIHIVPEIRPKYAVLCKIFIDGAVAQTLSKVAPSDNLEWDFIQAIGITASNSIVTLKIYKRHTFGTRRIASVDFPVQEARELGSKQTFDSFNIIREATTPKCGSWNITIKCSQPRKPVDAALAMASKALEGHKSILDGLGKTRRLVESSIALGNWISLVHPVAQVAFAGLTAAYTYLEEVEQVDQNLISLVAAMGRIEPFVKRVEKHAKAEELKGTIIHMWELIQSAAFFIQNYKLDNVAVRALKSLVTSDASDEVAKFQSEFAALTDVFDRGTLVQVLDAVMSSEERDLLKELRPVRNARYNLMDCCMAGTRKALLSDIDVWARSSTNEDKMYWVYGLAGSGKTAIATSVADRAAGSRDLGGTFFCKREDPELRDPQRVIPTLAAQMAISFPPFGSLVAAALHATPDLADRDISSQYHALIAAPLKALGPSARPTPLLVVVDALDECGTPQSRRRLIRYLREMSDLVPWLKVFITSRPNQDICGSLEGYHISRRDLRCEDVGSDMLLFARERIADIVTTAGLDESWPGEEKILKVAERAQGLFIWVDTVHKFILDGMDQDARLDIVLSGEQSRDANTQLSVLYTVALEESIAPGADNTELFQKVVGAITSAYAPLSVSALAALLGNSIKPETIRSVLRRLGSVLYEASDDCTIRICHPSFVDFLTNPDLCPRRFHVKRPQQNTDMAMNCLRIIGNEFHFDMRDLAESSNAPNSSVDDASRHLAFSSQLQYSYTYWADHISRGVSFEETKKTLAPLLDNLMLRPYLMYWLEALGLLNDVRPTISPLGVLQDCIDDTPDHHARFIKDICLFMSDRCAPIALDTTPPSPSILGVVSTPSLLANDSLANLPKHIKIPEEDMASGRVGAAFSIITPPNNSEVAPGSVDGDPRTWGAETGVAIGKPRSCDKSVVILPNYRSTVSGSDIFATRVLDPDAVTFIKKSVTQPGRLVYAASSLLDTSHLVSTPVREDKIIQARGLPAFMGNIVLTSPLHHSSDITSLFISPDKQAILSNTADIPNLREKPTRGSDERGHGKEKDIKVDLWSPDDVPVVPPAQSNNLRGVTERKTGVACPAYSLDVVKTTDGSDANIPIWDTSSGDMPSPKFLLHSEGVGGAAWLLDKTGSNLRRRGCDVLGFVWISLSTRCIGVIPGPVWVCGS